MKLPTSLCALILQGAFFHCWASSPTVDSLMEQMGLVDVQTIDTTIVVNLVYATPDNFVGKIMYVDGPTKAYLHPSAAKALAKASAALQEKHPGLRLKIYDASRPMSAQKLMYKTVRGTSKAPYVSNPANGGGLHNYGFAVDVTLVDTSGRELPMGTSVDHLGKEANIDNEEQLVKKGVISSTERENRHILREAMRSGGFSPLRSEWWHFNLITRREARQRHKLINF